MSSLAGLSTSEATVRLREVGPNDVAAPARFGALRALGGYATNPLVLILLAASATSAMLGEVSSAIVVLVMILLSIALNFLQSYRSQQAAHRLRERLVSTSAVVRDGRRTTVPVREIVPGDVVLLAAGTLVPADARVLRTKDLFVQESALTGESIPREKHVADDPAIGMVYRGTTVTSGLGAAEVVRTGAATQFGHIAATLAARPPETEYERGTREFGLLVLRVVVSLVLFVFLANALGRREPLDAFLFAVALAVGLTPELLPMIVAVTLARGAVRMAERKVIVKHLAAIENLGSMDVLCSDKTGTLTEGRICVERHIDVAGRDSERVMRLAALNSFHQTGVRNPMDDAILRHADPSMGQSRSIDEIPFDFTRRRSSVVVEDGPRMILVTKGAPESVLPVCTGVDGDGGQETFDATARAAAEDLVRDLGRDGLRVLAVACRDVGPQPTFGVEDEANLTLVGFAAFSDPPLASAAAAIAALRADSVTVKILTGDCPEVTAHLCATIGIDPGRIATGSDVEPLTDMALGALAERTTVFARITPAQKDRIVRALHARGHVVGCMGDGINDAAALHSADVGISVSDAVDVAREAADIILLEKRLAVLHEGIVEGRRSFGNVMKYVLMGTSSNFGNMLSMALASVALPFLPMLPLQVLLANFLYDCAQVAIPTDEVDRADLRVPRRWDAAFIRRYMLVLGPVSSLYDVLTFGAMLWLFHADASLFRTGWFVESLATQTLVVFVIRTRHRPWRSRPSRSLVAGIIAVLAIAIILPYTPIAQLLGFAPLPPAFFAFLAPVVLTYLLMVEMLKTRLTGLRSAPARA
jgi:Mg2+-importing ATPase